MAVTEEYDAGFHEILSFVAQLQFGDYLQIELVENAQDEIHSDFPGLPLNEDNIIMKAIRAFRQKHPFDQGVRVRVDKRIPLGAGLGGGSSNAVAMLKGLNTLFNKALSEEELCAISSGLGSDCPLFFEHHPVILRGRGEIIDTVDKKIVKQLYGQRILVFKPDFSVNTVWAYQQLKLNPQYYIKKKKAEGLLKEKLQEFSKAKDIEKILYNNFENIIFKEYPNLKEMMSILHNDFKIKGLLSGSGSACFVILKETSDVSLIRTRLREVFGKGIFIVETKIQ